MVLASCTKWDDFKKFTKDGENIYTGKMDSVTVYSGRLRARLTGILPADPKIVKCKITWNSGQDSVVFPISKGGEPMKFDETFKVEEGVQNFAIQTFDAAGNGSVIVHATGTVYGPRYEAGLANRPVSNAQLFDDGNAIVTWGDINTSLGPQGTWLSYVNNDGDTVSVFFPISASTDTLVNFKQGTKFIYKTVYIPDSLTIDTFYTAEKTHSVKSDVTSLYLSNTGPGFQRATYDGRWGTLAAPWITNAAAKNKDGGTNGGYTSDWRWDHSGQICWETWGSTPITDGKIYQTTSQPLPAGNYTVTFRYYSEIQSNSSVYCIAAAGSAGIPSLSQLSGALGYSLLYNGANVGSTSPHLDEVRSFTFTLDQPQAVSIGFLGNLAGNGNPGNYFVVDYIKLIQN